MMLLASNDAIVWQNSVKWRKSRDFKTTIAHNFLWVSCETLVIPSPPQLPLIRRYIYIFLLIPLVRVWFVLIFMFFCIWFALFLFNLHLQIYWFTWSIMCLHFLFTWSTMFTVIYLIDYIFHLQILIMCDIYVDFIYIYRSSDPLQLCWFYLHLHYIVSFRDLCVIISYLYWFYLHWFMFDLIIMYDI